ncbi:hypothetical protein REC12_00415 [Desulfosporosinus sp. PR]|uniref:Cas10/Cmr2 second palm domain-containing protein n=1 Tax=Candidatus Desulfosporosinus nitrosoreducens TaxID=3401928 RepID=UPI0027F59F13|nr:hypothetical protein [Desulfosporosinus sp. PR]MDQ7092058.1 hypothetical protein [Desulfosporosinus sp. PR]
MPIKQIVALSIDKVQTCLFEVIHGHEQEKQTEEATLRNIMNASREISGGFADRVRLAFFGVRIEELLECSGVFIFSCPLPEKELNAPLNELFLEYYRNSHGQKLVRYVAFAAEGLNKIEAIQKAKRLLKQSSCLNAIIEKNQKTLFSFQVKKNQPPSKNDRPEGYPMFARDINALFCGTEEDNKNRFRIAVIKADLDGMGDMFKAIQDYVKYQDVSKVLNDCISLDALHQAAEVCSPEGRKGWLFPFYIAGDDIFFAVAVTDMLCGIEVCRQLLRTINCALAAQSQSLKISIGAEVTFNREPIRYYLEMVERQLKQAKKVSASGAVQPKGLQKYVNGGIAIGGLAFWDVDYDKYKEDRKTLPVKEKTAPKRELESVPVWRFFLTDVSLLLSIQKEGKDGKEGCRKGKIGTHRFYYALLEKLAQEDVRRNERKYLNQLLYHLLPQYLDSYEPELWQSELILNAGILEQLYQRQLGKEREGLKIRFDDEGKKRLETYLRLMLLFSDTRFGIVKTTGSDEALLRKERLDEARKKLLTKVVMYLRDQSLDIKEGGKEQLRDVFIHNQGKRYYRLRLEKSMFFKLRNASVERAGEILALNCPVPEDEGSDSRENQESETGYRVHFDQETFCKRAKNNGAWNPEFVDSLMLYYEYTKMVGKYKRQMGQTELPRK